MKRNNRIPQYVPKEYPVREVYHVTKKNGVSVFVKGSEPDPYRDIPCESFKLKSRIDTGVFENHEGSPRQLERAQGSDIMEREIERAQNEYEQKKDTAVRQQNRKKLKEEMLKAHPEIEPLL